MYDFIVVDLANLIARSEMVKAGFLSTSTGLPSGHVFRAYRSILKLKKDLKGELIFALEGQKQKRYEDFPEYKAQRLEWREGIAAGTIFDPRPDIKEMCAYMKCRSIQADGYEADDAIATFVNQNRDRKTMIVSTDKDLWTLLQYQHVDVQNLKGWVGRKEVEDVYGTSPQNIPMVKALYGDVSDNIPKVPGLRWNSIKGAFGVGMHSDPTSFFVWAENNAAPATLSLLNAHRAQIEKMYRIASLEENADLKYENLPGKPENLLAFLQKFECKSLYETVNLLT